MRIITRTLELLMIELIFAPYHDAPRASILPVRILSFPYGLYVYYIRHCLIYIFQ